MHNIHYRLYNHKSKIMGIKRLTMHKIRKSDYFCQYYEKIPTRTKVKQWSIVVLIWILKRILEFQRDGVIYEIFNLDFGTREINQYAIPLTNQSTYINVFWT
jgi:hypothetical protein